MSRHLWTEEDMINFLSWCFVECKEAIELGDYLKVKYLLTGAAALAEMGLTAQSNDRRLNSWLAYRVSKLYCVLPAYPGDVMPHISDNEMTTLMKSLELLSIFFNDIHRQTVTMDNIVQLPEDFDEDMFFN